MVRAHWWTALCEDLKALVLMSLRTSERKRREGGREGEGGREASRQAEAVHLGPEATVKTGFD